MLLTGLRKTDSVNYLANICSIVHVHEPVHESVFQKAKTYGSYFIW